MSYGNIRWAAFQPLIGGCAIGAQQSFGTPPTCVIDYDGVENSNLYVDYMKNRRDVSLKHFTIDGAAYSLQKKLKDSFSWNDPELKNLDVVVGVPICAGLSSANTQNGADSKMGRGSNAMQNNNMISMLDITLNIIKPKVYIFENAYKLATPLGKDIKDRLIEMSNRAGYTTSLVKVNTLNHGLPQNRTRTFFYAWRDDYAYNLTYEKSPNKLIMDVIGDLKNQKAATEFPNMKNWLDYLKDKFGSNYRAEWEKRAHGADEILASFNDFDYAMKFFNEKDQKRLQYWKEKKAKGLGWMAESPLWLGPAKIPSLYSRTMARLIHPVEERTYSVREIMRLMGLPDDFDCPPKNKVAMVGQNVPVCTAAYYADQVVRYLDGKLEMSGKKNVEQDFCLPKAAKKNSELKTGFTMFQK